MTGSTAIVIGATGGIGQNVARYARQHFDTTLLVGRSSERLRNLEEDLLRDSGPGGKLETAVADIGDFDRMRGVLESSPAPGFVALCTGITELGTLEIGHEQLQRMLSTNLTGVIVTLQAAVQRMLSDRSGGLVVALGSMSIRRQRPSLGGYAATQTGLYGFCRSLRRELADSSVRLTLICPGFARTGLAIEETPDIDPNRMIPVSDIIETIDFLLGMPSNIDIPEVFLDCKAQLNYPR